MSEHNGTNVSQPQRQAQAPPQPGEPYNFNQLLRGVFIPSVLVGYRRLPPAARLLWAVIRARSFRSGVCTTSNSKFAGLICIAERRVRAHLATLTREGFLRTVVRPGRVPERYLLWHEIFASPIQIEANKQARGADEIVQGGGRNRPPNKGITLKERRIQTRQSLSRGVEARNASQGLTPISKILQKSEAALQDRGSPPPPAGNANIHPASALAENEAMSREISALGFRPHDKLLSELLEIAHTHGVSGFQVAAAINRAMRKARRRASLMPRTEAWIIAVVQAECSGRYPLSRRGVGG